MGFSGTINPVSIDDCQSSGFSGCCCATEDPGLQYAQGIQTELQHHPQCQQTISSAATKVDAAGFGEVTHGYRNVTQPETEVYGLRKIGRAHV